MVVRWFIISATRYHSKFTFHPPPGGVPRVGLTLAQPHVSEHRTQLIDPGQQRVHYFAGDTDFFCAAEIKQGFELVGELRQSLHPEMARVPLRAAHGAEDRSACLSFVPTIDCEND